MILADLDDMVAGYIECALFTADEELITPKSGQFDPSPYLGSVSEATRAEARAVCEKFLRENATDLEESFYPPNCAGHDLWYTRNGHGCGFWECDYCESDIGDRLTIAAEKLGACHVWKDGRWFKFERG